VTITPFVKESVPLPTVRITLTGENPLGNAVEIAAPTLDDLYAHFLQEDAA